MQKDFIDTIIKAYKDKHRLYSIFTEKIAKLINDLLEVKNVKIHSITFRIKEEKSLLDKLNRPDYNCSKLSDINDIAGVRIITYFEDDVDLVAGIIKKEFDIDMASSVDKRQLLDPDRFGYLSLHYVAKLSSQRLQLAEYKSFSDCKVEIQIRSILQHAWAEIEHDLGYKLEISVPKMIKRRFSRLAGLLELADNEFINIRNRLQEYKEVVTEQINTEPTSVLIDKVSLQSYIRNNKLVNKLDEEIARFAKASIVDDDKYLEHRVSELYSIGLKTIAELDAALNKFSELVVPFAQNLFDRTYEQLNKGISIFHLCYIIVGCEDSIDKLINYLKVNRLGSNKEQAFAERIISICYKIRKKRESRDVT